MAEITKEQFMSAYNKHLPSKWIKFAYKYFSKETENKDMILSNIITTVLLLLFFVGLLGTMFNLSSKIIAGATITYSIMVFLLGIYLFSAVKLNNLRINRICKELNITNDEFTNLVYIFNL